MTEQQMANMFARLLDEKAIGNVEVGSKVSEEGAGSAIIEEIYNGTINIKQVTDAVAIAPNAERPYQSEKYRFVRMQTFKKSTLTGELVPIGNIPINIFDKEYAFDECEASLEKKITENIPIEGGKLLHIRYPEKYVIRDKATGKIKFITGANGKPTTTPMGANSDWVYVDQNVADWQTVVRRAIRRRRDDFIGAGNDTK